MAALPANTSRGGSYQIGIVVPIKGGCG